MTLSIHRKQLPFPDFEARVVAFRQARLDHQKTVDVPAPAEHALVEAAVRRVPRGDQPDDYAADYQIVEPTLEEKKKDIEHELHKARDAALFKKLSSAKRRALVFDVADVRAKHPDDLSEADKAVLKRYEDLACYDHRIERHAVKLHVQVDDLTEATVDSWAPEPFPES